MATLAVAVDAVGRPFRWLTAALSCTSSFLALGSFLPSTASPLAADLTVAVADCPEAGPAMILSTGFFAFAGPVSADLSSSTERWCCRSASRSRTLVASSSTTISAAMPLAWIERPPGV